MCADTGLSAPTPCADRGTYCPPGSFQVQQCGANMTTSNTSLASDPLDCLCVPGTHLADPNSTAFPSCAPCVPGGSYYQPLAVRAASCLLCDAGTSTDGTDCPPAPTPASPIGAIVGGAGAAVVFVGVVTGLLLSAPGAVMQAFTGMRFASEARPEPPTAMFSQLTLVTPSHPQRDAWRKMV